MKPLVIIVVILIAVAWFMRIPWFSCLDYLESADFLNFLARHNGEVLLGIVFLLFVVFIVGIKLEE